MRAREFIIEDQPDNPDSWESQAADAERDAETVRMADQDAAAGGLAEEQLDEKSTSQAQFRTMAAAAHNPEFARKVGISPDVAKEFHGADKKSNYKSLPRKAAEGEIDEVLGFVISRPKQTKKPETSLEMMRK